MKRLFMMMAAVVLLACLAVSCHKEKFEVPTLMGRAFCEFNESKPIVFHYKYRKSVEGAVRIDDRMNDTPIWRKTNTNQVDIYTPAAQINAPANCDWMFYCCRATSIDFGGGLNTANVTNMNSMFYGCEKLTSLDLSSFNTANVTDISFMFLGCQNLTSLNLSSFNTTNVTDMSLMFRDCKSLTSLNLSSFNTANVTDMRYMFRDCKNLTNLNLSSFNTANVTNMSSMFKGCQNLTSLNLTSFNTANVTDMSHMFSGCISMNSIEFASSATINSPADIRAMLSSLGTEAAGGCTIHCNESVKNRLMSSDADYDADYVHFNTTY